MWGKDQRRLRRDMRRTVRRELKRAHKRTARHQPGAQGAYGATTATEQPRPMRVMRVAASAAWKFRHQLTPLGVLGATHLAGLLVHIAAHGLGLVLVCGALVAAGWWLFTRRWLDETRERVYALAVLALVLAWLVLAAVRGTGAPMPAVLWGGGCLVGMPWWWRHRIRPAALVAPDTTAEDIWAERVAASGRALPGSRLVDVTQVAGGWRGRIRLVAGDKSTDDAIGATLRIASAFEKPAAQVIVEPTVEGIESHAQLTVLTRNPLHQVRHWQGPSFDPATGVFDLGVYADSDIARFMFVEPGSGAQNALVVGTKGSGKTNTVNTIITEAHLSRLVVVWLIDPQMGQSLPAWNQHVDWAALGVEQAMVMLRAYHRVMMARSAHMAHVEWTDEKGRRRVGMDHYDVSPSMPLHYLVLEEAHHLLGDTTYGPEAVERIEDIGKMGRKTGSAICLVNQMGSLAELGGSQTLRAMVSSDNVVVHRTADRVTSNMAFSGALPVEPHRLPRRFPDGTSTHGLGYLLGHSARHAAFRSYLVDDPYGIASSLPALPLDPVSASAAGEMYANRHDGAAIDAAVKVLDGGSVVKPGVSPPRGDSAGRQSGLAREVLRYLPGRGEVERGEIIHATGGSPRGVANALNTLIADGLIEKTDRGVYRALDTDTAREPVA